MRLENVYMIVPELGYIGKYFFFFHSYLLFFWSKYKVFFFFLMDTGLYNNTLIIIET